MFRALVVLASMSTVGWLTSCGGSGSEGGSPPATSLDASPLVECVSTRKDPHDIGLRRTRLRLLDDGLEVTWTTAKNIRASASSFEVELTDQWGIRRGNLSLGLWDGEIASLLGQEYLATMARRGFSDEEFVDGPPVITGGHSITMVYPRSVIDDNERATHWRANIGGNVKGEDWNDWCSDPAPGEDLPEPTLLPGIT